ncbi:Zinc finger protein 208 [Plakobranchus ocellatus]|uniref:Zinc finger protein 208 n=1 Tax=Plakobranchus ocellatus TaxID=259542 RepID=A0AAV4DIV3_9GAST|nr:Zinc finger protein 208 [Plakobranchus ocellatus]
MEQNHFAPPPAPGDMIQPIQAAQNFEGTEIKLEEQAVHIEHVYDGSKDPKVEGDVQVIYLDVPETEEPQVLDLSSLLAQQGIQVVDQTEIQTIETKDGRDIFHAEDIVIEESGGGNNITMVAASQSEAQSAHALLNLANAQAEESSVQVSDILAAQRQAQENEENAAVGKALLQLAADQSAGTFIVDENGTMVPLSDVRDGNMLHVEDTGVTTIAICQCYCGREFISQEDLERHKAAHKLQRQTVPSSSQDSEVGNQTCTLCSAVYPSTRELMQHHKEVHPGEMPWQCNVCNKRYHKKIAMKAHMRVHNTLAKYQCSSCKKVFFYKSAMTRHIKQHTCEKPFKCTICGEMLNTLWELRKHRINHQVRSLYHCDICSKVFKQKATLVVHSRVHTGQRPYACDICHKSFSLKSTLTQHRRIHTGEKPNVCPICNQRFRQASTMQSHMKRHTHDKPYICRYCRMRFAYQDEVTEHELAHAHNKKWQCDECGMRFKNQSLLARHCRRHTNERPFVCEVCSKSFVQSGSLRAHMRSHTNEKPYFCRMCSKAYATSGTLLLHIRKVHNLPAKTVKEVFPVYKYIEDQKVFTIRNKPLGGSEMVVNSDTITGNGERVTVVVTENPEVQQTSGEVDGLVPQDKTGEKTEPQVVQDGNIVVIKNEAEFPVQMTQGGDIVVDDRTISGDLSTVQQVQSTAAQPSETVALSLTKMSSLGEVWSAPDDGSEPVQVAAEVDISSHSLHSAQDRQEAALGLAELSLFGAGAAGSNPKSADLLSSHASAQQGQKTKTFFREEEEDENDPNVTKIILSKEGGVMNSQDPHQCPICQRIFGRKSIMVEHLRIHTDEKPYECDFCGSGFRQNAQLRSHIRNRHTRVERYQCSFCHNRFLSRSITIRHIKFHHKLKMKFCLEANPDWTIESAVWSDEKFEFNIEDPQYLKVGKKNKTSMKKIKKDLDADNGDEQLTQSLTDLVPPGQRYVIKVSDQGQITASEITVETTPVEGQESRGNNAEEGNDQSGARTVGTLTYATSDSKQGVEKAVADSEYLGSQLICGTCKMQFDSVSSLRAHLRSVHNTTLAESDVSYVFEDNVNTGQVQATPVVNKEGISDVTEQFQAQPAGQQEIIEEDVKPRVVSTGAVSHRKVKSEGINDRDVECLNICRMCSQGFFYRDDLDQHMKSHTEEEVEAVGMHRCDTCNLVLKNTQEVAKHIQRCHGVYKIFSCSICDKEFFQESSVYRHMKFFHKWEIKIRGEINIPVIVKPAPNILHKPASSSLGYVMPKTRTDKKKVSKLGKLSNQSSSIGAKVDKIIESIVEPRETSHETVIGSTSTSELPGQDEVQIDKSGSISIEESHGDKDNQVPSFIIVRDGSLTQEGDTQRIVDKLMTLFRSKVDSADGEAKRLPKIVKVTTVGFTQDELNAITEAEVSEALAQIENSEVKSQVLSSGEKLPADAEKDSAMVITEMKSQNLVDGEETVSGKGYISTLQGKKKVVTLEQSSSDSVVVKKESDPDDLVSHKSIQVQVDASSKADNSLEQIIKGEIRSDPHPKDVKSNKSTQKIKREHKGSNAMEKNSTAVAGSSQFSLLGSSQRNAHGSTGHGAENMLQKGDASQREKDGQSKMPHSSKISGSASEKSTVSTLTPLPLSKDGFPIQPTKATQNLSKTGNAAPSLSKKKITSKKSIDKQPGAAMKKASISTDKIARVTLERADVSPSVLETKSSGDKIKASSGAKTTKGKDAAAHSKKKKEKAEAEPERRSSSGRLIKRKMFGDEIEDMSPLRKHQK